MNSNFALNYFKLNMGYYLGGRSSPNPHAMHGSCNCPLSLFYTEWEEYANNKGSVQ